MTRRSVTKKGTKQRRSRHIKRKSIKRKSKVGKIKKIYRFGGDDDVLANKTKIVALLRQEMTSVFPEIDPSYIEIRPVRQATAAFIHILNCRETLVHHGGYWPSIDIDFSQNMMKINLLIGCSPITGREMLARFISLARRLGLSYIMLTDDSELYVHPSVFGRRECVLDLARLRILQKGESWYESLGFVSDRNEVNRVYNESIRAMPLREFVDAVASRDKKSSGEALLASLLDAFPSLDGDMRVSDAIQMMLTAVNEIGTTVCEENAFVLLKRLIDGCKPLLRYEYANLVLDLK
jgi:hypothetical protein